MEAIGMIMIAIVAGLWLLWMYKQKYPDDWIVVWTESATWEINASKPEFYYTDFATYEILYSPARERLKLTVAGHKPKEHDMYKFAVKEQNRRWLKHVEHLKKREEEKKNKK